MIYRSMVAFWRGDTMNSGHFKGQNAASFMRRDKTLSARFWQNALAATLAGERDRWALWCPVFFGVGIAAYFSLPIEPPLLPLMLCSVLAGLMTGVAHWMGAPRLSGILILLLFALFGLTYSVWKTQSVAAPVLERAQVFPGMSGRVTAVETFPDGARIRLQDLDFGW
ncbi:MAG TPA: hypothetical protein DD390_12645, partial [Rhodospirillaceae bacterium]|nr:hypothetical protein [Rhodospirillaceae bacterium]